MVHLRNRFKVLENWRLAGKASIFYYAKKSVYCDVILWNLSLGNLMVQLSMLRNDLDGK